MTVKMFSVLAKARPDIEKIKRLNLGGQAYDRSND
jgi:hypothetical protein